MVSKASHGVSDCWYRLGWFMVDYFEIYTQKNKFQNDPKGQSSIALLDLKCPNGEISDGHLLSHCKNMFFVN